MAAAVKPNYLLGNEMRLLKLEIKNFRGIKEFSHDFTSPFYPAGRPLTCIIGDNGSGKTSVLQAIALFFSIQQGAILSPTDFDWLGESADRLGGDDSRASINVEVLASANEYWRLNDAFLFLAGDAAMMASREDHVVFDLQVVKHTWRSGEKRRNNGFIAFQSAPKIVAEFNAEGITQGNQSDGGVYWIDDKRDFGRSIDGGEHGASSKPLTLKELRQNLVGNWAYHKSAQPDPEKDVISKLSTHLAAIFPDLTMIGVEPRAPLAGREVQDFDFMFGKGEERFELGELSSGELVVFELLYRLERFTRPNSIVLIDEIELHLHLPEQQRLLRVLRGLSSRFQFIFTTHSSGITDVHPNDHEVAMPGGMLCL